MTTHRSHGITIKAIALAQSALDKALKAMQEDTWQSVEEAGYWLDEVKRNTAEAEKANRQYFAAKGGYAGSYVGTIKKFPSRVIGLEDKPMSHVNAKLRGVIGAITETDVGKQVFESNNGIWSVENNEQRDQRLKKG